MTESSNIYDRLKALAISGRMPHAMIIEDTDTERALEEVLMSAKIMMCSAEERPCGECGNCIKVANNSHTDIKILKPDKDISRIKVDDIREIREDVHILSIEGNHKFYIIKDADLMTVQAQNAFIKILEEPPQNISFILICGVATALLPTVRSRCQMYSNYTGNDTASEEILELSSRIADMCIACDVCGLMSAVESIGNDRNRIKSLLESIIEEIIKRFAEGDLDNVKDVVEELWDLLKIANNNININLLKGRIMAALVELGGIE